MKNHITTLLGLVFVFALSIPMGCKKEKKIESVPMDESPSQEAIIEAEKMEADSLQTSTLQFGGAVIKLVVNDPKNLFESPGSSNIEAGNPNLDFLAMESQGIGNIKKTDETTSPKDFVSDVYKGKPVIWMVIIDPQAPNKNDYNISIQQIELASIDQECKIFEESLKYPSSGIVVQANVRNEDDVIGCLSPYAIWFDLTDSDGNSRSFRLDPFILGNP